MFNMFSDLSEITIMDCLSNQSRYSFPQQKVTSRPQL